MPPLSLIICTHNPRAEFLRQTLDAIRAQTLAHDQWEFLLIDNASKQPLAAAWDLSWHPNGRHVHENQLGLTPARLRGIREARGSLIVFVDDDNLLAPDYLEQAVAMAREWPMLGVWGGRIEGRYEVPPAAWTKPYLGMLAIREFDRDRWSNRYDDGEAHPCGAGMIVRKHVAEVYAAKVGSSQLRLGLGRKGASLASCEDLDLAFTALDLGLGMGMFQRLRLTHLIPAARLEQAYLLRLAESGAFSSVILRAFREQAHARPSRARELYQKLRLPFMNSHDRQMELAFQRGVHKARVFLRSLQTQPDAM